MISMLQMSITLSITSYATRAIHCLHSFFPFARLLSLFARRPAPSYSLHWLLFTYALDKGGRAKFAEEQRQEGGREGRRRELIEVRKNENPIPLSKSLPHPGHRLHGLTFSHVHIWAGCVYLKQAEFSGRQDHEVRIISFGCVISEENEWRQAVGATQ